MQYRVLVVAACLSLAACFEGPVTFQVPPLSGPLVSVTTGAAGAAAPVMTAAGSSAPRTVARTVAITPPPRQAIAPVLDAPTPAPDDAGMPDDAGDVATDDAGSAADPATEPDVAADDAGVAEVDAGVPVPAYPATRCQTPTHGVVDCRPQTLRIHYDWTLIWIVAHEIPDGISGVTYLCQQGAPACVTGAECSVAIAGNPIPVWGTCL